MRRLSERLSFFRAYDKFPSLLIQSDDGSRNGYLSDGVTRERLLDVPVSGFLIFDTEYKEDKARLEELTQEIPRGGRYLVFSLD